MRKSNKFTTLHVRCCIHRSVYSSDNNARKVSEASTSATCPAYWSAYKKSLQKAAIKETLHWLCECMYSSKPSPNLKTLQNYITFDSLKNFIFCFCWSVRVVVECSRRQRSLRFHTHSRKQSNGLGKRVGGC